MFPFAGISTIISKSLRFLVKMRGIKLKKQLEPAWRRSEKSAGQKRRLFLAINEGYNEGYSTVSQQKVDCTAIKSLPKKSIC